MDGEVRSEKRRGRKRKRLDAQNAEVDEHGKKMVVGFRPKRLVGCYVRKEFEGSGFFLGKIVSYDSGLYRVDYEDGDCEDLDSGELKAFLIEESDITGKWLVRKHKLDNLILSKDEDEKGKAEENASNVVSVDDGAVTSAVDVSIEAANTVEIEGVKLDQDDNVDLSDSCDDDLEPEPFPEVEMLAVPPPEFPPSSGNIGIPAEYVSHLFSVYSFLRSFSIQLFLSPFGLDDFVGSLNCSVPNTLLDSIHVALMRALRRYFEKLSAEGSELASKCLRGMDWSLLDALTWPVYLVHYLIVMGYTDAAEWKGFYLHALEGEYYALSAGMKLKVLQILCDDVLDSEEVRTEIDARAESEVGVDQESGIALAPVSGPRRVHPRNSKTSAFKGQEVMHIIAQSHETKVKSDSNHLGLNNHGRDAISIDEDGNGDECRLCGMDGTLLCCDGCPASYHPRCIGVNKLSIPPGAWYCPECTIDKVGPKISRGTSLKAAEIFGVDVYGQAFLGCCDHLLVLSVSTNSTSCIRYYSSNDIANVLQLLLSSTEHIVTYSEICKAIIQYWEIPDDIFSITQAYGTAKQSANEDVKSSMPSSIMPLGLTSHYAPEAIQNVDIGNSGNMSKDSLVAFNFPDHVGQIGYDSSNSEQVAPFTNILKLEDNEVKGATATFPFACDAVLSDSMGNGKSGPATCKMESIAGNCGENVNEPSIRPKLTIRIKGIKSGSGKSDGNSSSITYMGSSFKVQGYVNNYLHGDFAASAAANLSVLSSEENQVSGSNSSERRRLISANISLQVKAFSSAAVRFFWPHTEKKLIEVPRERCSWCFCCKAQVVSKRGCLLNAAASNATKSAMKTISCLRNVKGGDGVVPGIAMYVMFMEESLCGLTVGPFLSPEFRSQWRRRMEKANNCSAIKLLLLELEENLRAIALSGDWFKLVDGWSAEPSVIQNAANAPGSTQKRRPGRRGRRSAAVEEATADDDQDTLNDFTWWRGGKLAKHLFQKSMLPCMLVKKAARQGGSRKIPGVCYAETSEAPKRSRRLVWRAAVEMSRNVSQLALQVRYLDFHVRWNDLSRPEPTTQDPKGSETEASAFRNANICDKRILDNDIRYCVAFGSQKHLPSRVMKNVVEVEDSQDGIAKYWFSETRIPLYLIKEYEEKACKAVTKSTDKPVDTHVIFDTKKLKTFRKDIFSYLARKRQNLEKCSCALCEKDLLYGDAVSCIICQGLYHDQCAVSSITRINEEVKYLITCKRCYQTRAPSQIESSNESPTSPLHLQGQEFSNMVINQGVQLTNSDHSSITVKSLQPSQAPTSVTSSKSSSKSKRKLLSWGLIWKRKNPEDDGSDFRRNNILMKDPGSNFPDISCYLCQKPYNPDLMYIRCEDCLNWYHAVAVELEESKILELYGYKCCRCRRIKTAECPFEDQVNKRKSKSKKKAEKDSNLDIISPSAKVEPPSKKKVAHVEVESSHLNHTSVEQLTEQNSNVNYGGDAATLSRSGPQKLPVRRHNKHEKEDNSSNIGVASFEGNIFNSVEGSLAHAEWDVSANGVDDSLMFNYEDLSYEDMEFEPQTYFSFNELLASDDGVPQNGSSENADEGWEKSSLLHVDDVTDLSFYPEESSVTVEHAVDIVPCKMCSFQEPSPDLCCHICGLWIHGYCSPWDEPAFFDEGWRCGNCREWV
ncbi:OLC1v1004470C3 [Oldenlandia corymbosa var. corymbosa]|uniref:OLC1v1004470C3 n=1 Tax=Oldenlandia corymbosa var. corymbosa TaxID=529605 RepID=A0AAV1DED1_OLDCO|nr:OLC1v1004470C3 [Oldenlandia corymbosa var. corymbosa]